MADGGSDELRLTVTLVDNASAGLRQLQGQLQTLGGGQTAEGINRMRRNVDEAHRGMKPFFETVEKAGKNIIPEFAGSMIRGATAMAGFTLSTAGVIGGITGIVGAFLAANKAYGDFAEKM